MRVFLWSVRRRRRFPRSAGRRSGGKFSKERVLRVVGADEDEFIALVDGMRRLRVDDGFAPVLNRDHGATCFFPDTGLRQHLPDQGPGGRQVEEIQSLRQKHRFLIHQKIEDGVGAERGVGHDKVRSRAVQRGDIAVLAGAAQDLHVRTKTSQIFCEINIGGVIVRGNERSGGFFKPGLLQGVNVRRVAENKMFVLLAALFGPFDNQVGDVRFLKATGDGMADASAADNHDRVARHLADLIEGIHLVVGRHRGFRSGEHQNTGAIDDRFRSGNDEISPLPDARHGQAEGFADSAFGQCFADQRRADHRRLRDDHLIVTADNVGFAVSRDGPGGKRSSQQIVKLQDARTSRQLEDVHGIGRLRRRDNRQILEVLPQREGDVSVHLVAVGGHDQRGVLGAQPGVGFGIVDVADGDADVFVVELKRLLQLIHDDDVVLPVADELFNQVGGHRVIMRNDHVVAGIRRELPRSADSCLRLHPGGEKKLDKDKGEKDQKENYTGKKH